MWTGRETVDPTDGLKGSAGRKGRRKGDERGHTLLNVGW